MRNRHKNSKCISLDEYNLIYDFTNSKEFLHYINRSFCNKFVF